MCCFLCAICTSQCSCATMIFSSQKGTRLCYKAECNKINTCIFHNQPATLAWYFQPAKCQSSPARTVLVLTPMQKLACSRPLWIA